MVPISTATALNGLISLRSLPPGGGAAPDFALALSTLLLPGAPAEPGEAPAAEGEERQALAGSGKDLPEAFFDTGEKPGDDKADSDEPDVPFAWFAIAQPPVQAEPLGIELPRPVGPQRVPESGGQPVPVLHFPGDALARAGFGTPAPVVAQAGTAPGEASPAPIAPATVAAAPQPSVSIPASPASVAAMPTIAAPRVASTPVIDTAALEAIKPMAAPIRIELPALKAEPVALPPLPQLAQQPLVQPRAEAVQPLVAPILLNGEIAIQPRRAAPREIEPLAATIAQTSGETVRPHQVAAANDAQQPALDMRRHEWMATMIERIEALRDSPGSRETTIRLTPDALGTVDVSIRHEGDRVHVRIAADTQAARALLNEAQPRLAELAEARGIKLGHTAVGVDAGNAGLSQQPRQEAPRGAPTSPASAITGGAEPEAETDQRIA